jgi:hypothetical protein
MMLHSVSHKLLFNNFWCDRMIRGAIVGNLTMLCYKLLCRSLNPFSLIEKIRICLPRYWDMNSSDPLLRKYPFAKIIPNKLTKKQCLLRFLFEIWDCKSFVQYYLILTEILSVINSRKSGFAGMLQSDAVIWFQRYQRSYLRRGSISLARPIGGISVGG